MPEADLVAHPFGAEGADYVLLIRKVMLAYSVLCLMMNPQRQGSRADSAGGTTISRRSVLAAGGIVVFGGLSGYLDRVASAATNTGASPAAVFAGVGEECCFDYTADEELDSGLMLGEPRVTRLTPTLAAGSGVLSGEVQLEGWVTSSAVMAQDYNSSRSNKVKTQSSDEDSDGDGVDDGTSRGDANYNNTRSNRSTIRASAVLGDELDESNETFRAVSSLDDQLLEETEAAWESISKRSARTGRNPELDREVSSALEAMAETLSEMRTELERCSDDVCALALENVADREADVRRAQEYAEDGEWAAFGVTDSGGDDILTGEYLLPPATFDPSGSFSPDEQGALYRYLDGETTASERFTVCLPDAEVPGENGSIRDAVTPKRLIDYVTGQSDGSGRVYSWGDPDSDDDGISDCDETESGSRDPPGLEKVCHRVGPLADITAPTATGGGLEVVRADDGVALVRTSNESSDIKIEILMTMSADPIISGPDDGGDGSDGPESSTEAIYQSWSGGSNGNESESSIDSGFVVSQAMVQPPGCPHPFPALFYVARGQSDSQLVYTGGWIIDDAALYADSLTVLTMAGETRVVPVDVGDLDGDGFDDVVSRSLSSERARRGARLDVGTVESLVESGVLSAAGKKGYDHYTSSSSNSGAGRSTGGGGGAGKVSMTHLAIDAPILHLTNAGSASNEVKFKAGAELSGQVN